VDNICEGLKESVHTTYTILAEKIIGGSKILKNIGGAVVTILSK